MTIKCDIDEVKVISLIQKGLGETEIQKILCIGRKPVHRISKKYDLYSCLKQNNRLYKSNRLKQYREEHRNVLYTNIKNSIGEKIENYILNTNGSIIDVMRKFSLSKEHLYLFLSKNKNLYDKLKISSVENLKKVAMVNGKKAAYKLSNKELKPITIEIVKRFKILKETLKYKQKVYDAIREEFGFGEKKIQQLCKRYGYPLDNPQTGELNSMYGKSPGKNAGIGVKCWILNDGIKYFCRSSLELRVICYFIDKKIPFQISKHRIPYIDDGGNKRTYCPDIVITDNNKMIPHLYEIKPHMMTFIRSNIIKSNAAKEYCKKFGMEYGWFITEKRLDLTKYNLQYIMGMIKDKIVIIDDKNLEKLKRNVI